MSRRRCSRDWAQVVMFGLCCLAAGTDVLAAEALRRNAAGNAWLGIERGHEYADVFLDDDLFSGRYTLSVEAPDVGRQGSVYLVARLDGTWFMKTGGRWEAWDGSEAALQPYARTLLKAEEELQVLDAQRLLPADYRVMAGYRVDGGPLRVDSSPLRFSVQERRRDTLQRFASAEAMEAYLKQGMAEGGAALNYLPMLAVAEDSAAGAGGMARVSGTNLQEVGVDEVDSVKTDGGMLYTLAGCDGGACLKVFSLRPDSAAAERMGTFALAGKHSPEGMYLVRNRAAGEDLLVTVGGQQSFAYWYDIWGWASQNTELEFLGLADPAAPVSRNKITLDGSLVASRRVGDTLYLVTRHTPAVEGFSPYAFSAGEQARNRALLERVSLPQLLPKATDSAGRVRELVRSEDCYLPTSAVDESVNPSIITISAIPLADPAGMDSSCFLGGSETLYMTPDSLYLATTSQDYTFAGPARLIYQPDHRTAIHKFALSGGGVSYRGSGEVEGHLGWEMDKKSFRMGENGDYLNVATSLGATWDGSSTTRLTVLADSGFSDQLAEVAVINGIGKPGEQLYAARFLGERAYLVTFRLTDPLYVVDLSDQENPRIAGELEISGYSDYLHPMAGDLLLGVGKDAVPDESSGDLGGRGAWYQGLKLSLFDVSDLASPREIDSVELGRRGTESPLLRDHHALSFLPAGETGPARLALPVRVHDREPEWQGFDPADPSAWYDYSHTALYSFELDAGGIRQAGRITAPAGERAPGGVVTLADDMVETSILVPWRPYYEDRSVLLDDAVYYIHAGDVLTSFWGENR